MHGVAVQKFAKFFRNYVRRSGAEVGGVGLGVWRLLDKGFIQRFLES